MAVDAWQVLELQWEWELPWVALVLSFWTATDPLCAVNSRFGTAPEIFNRSLKFHEFSRVPEAWFDVVVQMFQCEFQRTYPRYSNPSILANLVGCQLVSYRVYLLTTYKFFSFWRWWNFQSLQQRSNLFQPDWQFKVDHYITCCYAKERCSEDSDVPGNAEGLVGGFLVEACDLPWVTWPQLGILFLKGILEGKAMGKLHWKTSIEFFKHTGKSGELVMFKYFLEFYWILEDDRIGKMMTRGKHMQLESCRRTLFLFPCVKMDILPKDLPSGSRWMELWVFISCLFQCLKCF